MSLYDIARQYNIDIQYLLYLLQCNNMYIPNIYCRLYDEDIYRINNILLFNGIIQPVMVRNQKPRNTLAIIIPVIIFGIILIVIIAMQSDVFAPGGFNPRSNDKQVSFETNAQASEDDTYSKVTYKWYYDYRNWEYTLKIPDSYNKEYIDDNRNYPGRQKYTLLVTDENDDKWVKEIADDFIKIGKEQGYSETKTVNLIVTFVQSLEYQDDKEFTGYSEYPKYPAETLHDKGGDCEDSSILLASILREMGYDVALLDIIDITPDNSIGHMAVGIKCSNASKGECIERDNKKYLYIETTARGWKIGQIPDEEKNATITVLPVSDGNKSFNNIPE